MKHRPQRTCCGCGAKRAQAELFRVASQGGAAPNLGREGRGAYLCFALECARKAWKKRAVERVLKLQVPLDAAFKIQIEAALESGKPNLSGENPHMN